MERWLLVAIQVCLSGAVHAQTPPPDGLQALLSSAPTQSPQTVRDLTPEWTQAVIARRGPAPPALNPASPFQSALLAGGGSGGDQGLYFTRGATVSIGGRTYLVAYAPQPKAADLSRMLENPQAPPTPDAVLDLVAPKLTLETPLALTLIDAASILSINGARPFRFEAERIVRPALSQAATAQTAMLAAILFPVFAQARSKAREVSSLSNLKQIGLGILMYSQDYDEVLPSMADLASLKRAIMPYLKNDDIFRSPTPGQVYRTNGAASRKPLAAIAAPEWFALVYEDPPGPDGKRGVLFSDGHARRLDAVEWEMAKRKSGLP